jgi:hypothetical protein
MHSRIEDFWVELEITNVTEHTLRSVEFYEEYSKRAIADTIRLRMKDFEKADINKKRELLATVEKEVEDFRAWLEETKNFERSSAHYVSVSLKSLLLGLPVGLQVAQLFGAILDAQDWK